MARHKLDKLIEHSSQLINGLKQLVNDYYKVYNYTDYKCWSKPKNYVIEDLWEKGKTGFHDLMSPYFIQLQAEIIPSYILKFFLNEIKGKGLDKIYSLFLIEKVISELDIKLHFPTPSDHCIRIIGMIHSNEECLITISKGINNISIENAKRKVIIDLERNQRELLNNYYTKKDKIFRKGPMVTLAESKIPVDPRELQDKNSYIKLLKETLEELNIFPQKVEQYLNNHLKNLEETVNKKVEIFNNLRERYENEEQEGLKDYLTFLLNDSWYNFEFHKEMKMEYDHNEKLLVIDYLLPNKEDIPNETINKKGDEWVTLSNTKFRKVYEDMIYSIVIRTLSEIFFYDGKKYIDSVCFNGKSIERSPSTGQFEEKYILSINVLRNQIENLDLDFIQPKECFKHLKGVSVSKLYELIEIKPIIAPKFADKRFVENKEIEVANSPNLAEMDWEDFEHLVRQIFEWEFSDKGGEVRVTQSSRDGGVDAIVNDPDPIRGGKIIIQAKRYTNTVGVSAVRDLYGTIINEGANKGILITTSDYGPDSYKFAQGKPITLLNGGHLLYLLEKHGKKAHINIEGARKNRKDLSS